MQTEQPWLNFWCMNGKCQIVVRHRRLYLKATKNNTPYMRSSNKNTQAKDYPNYGTFDMSHSLHIASINLKLKLQARTI